MKIIQSFWGGKNKDITNKYGWSDYRFHWLSWMLSCHQLRKFYNCVELYTDEFGYDILINKLKLPYTKVHVVLDTLNEIPSEIWATAKIYTYSLQDEPFLHVDGDVFIFEPFPEKLMQAGLITQNLEVTTSYYRNMWSKISPHLKFMPSEMQDFHNEVNNLAHNMGIFGGNDIDFLKEYNNKSLEFVYKNKSVWDKINLHNFNIFFEQVLFYECANRENKIVDVLFSSQIGDNQYAGGFADFDCVPHDKNYLHLIGNFKQTEWVGYKMAQYCLYHYPVFIENIINLITPEQNVKISFPINIEERERLILMYEETLFQEEITNERLISRDLFTYRNLSVIDQFEKDKIDFEIILLNEISFKQEDNITNVYSKEIGIEILIRELDELDELVLYELSKKSLLKSEIIKIVRTQLEAKEVLTQTQIDELENIIYLLIRNYIGMKICIVKESQKK